MKAFLALGLLLTGCGQQTVATTSASSAPSDRAIAKCEAGDSALCAELMENADSNMEFERFGNLSCKHGDARACEYLGNTLYIRSRAPRGSEDSESLLTRSQELYEAGCQHGEKHLCAFATKINAVGPNSDVNAQTMTQAACQAGMAEACELFAIASKGAKKAVEAQKVKEADAEGSPVGVFQMCVSKRGRVTNLNVVISTEFPEYDRKLFEKMQNRTYRPHEVNNRPVAVCTTITFVYTPK